MWYKENRSYILVFIIVFLFCINFISVYAADDLPEVSIAENDYELICVYNDGARLTISNKGLYLENTSNDVFSNASNNIQMYLTESQKPKFNTSGASYEAFNTCPSTLYVYKVAAADDATGENDSGDLDGVYNYYYATESDLTSEIGKMDCGFLGGKCWFGGSGTPTAEKLDTSAKLISEEAFLISSKTALICDYESIATEAYSTKQAASIYMYGNRYFIEMGGRVTLFTPNYKLVSCPSRLTEEEINNNNPNGKYLYLNNPFPQVIADNGMSTKFYYKSPKFFASVESNTCAAENSGDTCQQFQFIGSRNENPTDASNIEVCELLGNRTITLLGQIVFALQIVVATLVTLLIAIDIGRMVVAGNIEEELPKKKKSIIIRLIVMLIFFFAPFIVGLFITILQRAGINIGDLECFFSSFKFL